MGIIRNVAKACRDGVDVGLVESHVAPKNYESSKRLNREHVGMLLNVCTGKYNVLRAAFASVFLTCVLGGEVQAGEELPALDKEQDRDDSENLTCTNLRPAELYLRVWGRAD